MPENPSIDRTGAAGMSQIDARLRAIGDKGNIGITLYDRQMNALYYSEACERITGYSAEERARMNMPDWAHPDELEKMQAAAARMLESPGMTESFEARLRHKNGSWIWMEFTIQNLLEDPTVRALVTTFRDITGRKRAEEELLKSEELYRQTLENMFEGCMLIGYDWTYLYLNEAAARHGRKGREELLGRTMLEMYPGVEQSVIFARYRECMEKRVPQRFESSFTFQDGTTNWYELSVQPSPEGIFVLSIDITERKHAEEELRASENRFMTAFNLSPIANVIYDPASGKIVDANEVFLTMTGYGRQEVVGQTTAELHLYADLEDRKKIGAILEKIGSLDNYEFRIRRKSGEIISILDSAKTIDIGGEKHFLSSMIDVTERIQAEQVLRRLNRELQAIGSCNEALMRAEDEDVIVHDICRIICKEAGYRMAWVGYAQHDDNKTIRPIAWYGDEDGYLTADHITWADNDSGQGPTGIAIRSGEIVYVQDFSIDARMTLSHDQVAQRGYNSGIALPLRDENANVFGALTIYADEVNAFNPDEIHLLEELTGDLSYGITALRIRAQRRRAEEALRVSEAALNEAQRLADIGSWDWDATTDTISWSENYYRIYGLDPDQPTPNYVEHLEVYTKESADRLDAAVKNAMENGEPYELDLELAEPTETTRWIFARGDIKRGENGAITGLRGTAQNITVRKRAEKALHQSERFLDTVLEHIPNMLFVKEAENLSFVRFNKFGEELIGYSRDDMIGKTDYDFFPREEADFFTAQDKEIFKSKEIRDIPEEPISTRFLGQRLLHTRKIPILADDGKPLYLLGISEDITERKRAEDARKESEERYRTLFEDSKDMIIVTTLDGKILDINAAGVELLGCASRDELLHADIADKIYADPGDRHRMLSDLRQQGFLKDYAIDFKSGSGDVIQVSASLTPTFDDDGNIVTIRGMVRDMTGHIRLEEQLRQSQKLESVGQLAGGVAHDFNNFLTAIEGYTDLALLDIPEDSPAVNELREVRRSAERAANLARQLLIFSRREPVHVKPMDLNTTIGDLLKMLGRLLGEQYEIKADLAEDLWTVNADASNIEQVLMNLVVNARDAMPTGGEVRISTTNSAVNKGYCDIHHSARPGEFIRLSVADNGTGMDAETLSHIYEPFFTTKAANKGTGLGLSVVYGIVAQHEGWIDVESAPGKGTSFSIFLPASPFRAGDSQEEAVASADLHGGGENILLIEDEKVVREMAQKMLERNGYSVTSAGSAEEGVRLFEDRGGYDLVFSDVILPGQSGIAFTERLHEENPDLPVLLASGYSDATGQEKIRERGYPFVQKPYQLQELLRTIRDLIKS